MNKNEILFIEKRLKSIQSKYNFNPHIGAKQLNAISTPEMQRAFGELSFLIKLINHFKLEISIPYDKTGAKSQASTRIKPRQQYIYFARKFIRSNSNTLDKSICDSLFNNVWKIGCSYDPENRVKDLQTGNDCDLSLIYTIPGNLKLEQNLKRSLYKCKTRAKNKTHKGEWFYFSSGFVKSLVQYLRSNDFDHDAIQDMVQSLNK